MLSGQDVPLNPIYSQDVFLTWRLGISLCIVYGMFIMGRLSDHGINHGL